MPAGNHTVGKLRQTSKRGLFLQRVFPRSKMPSLGGIPTHIKHVFIWDPVNEAHSAAVAYNDLFSFHPTVGAPVANFFDADSSALRPTTSESGHYPLLDDGGEAS